MLSFDAETTRLLDECYHGADFTRRRRASFDWLRPASGDTILDIGCGNGLMTRELARAVGPKGRVIGVDPSPDMRGSAIERCAKVDWVEVVEGVAGALPLEDATIDKAVSIQVFEYLDDVPAAASEAFRVLRPGGLLVVGDMHFESLVWYSEQPDRMARMMASWDQHVVEKGLPALLPALFREAGFEVVAVEPETVCDVSLRPDGLANLMMQVVPAYAIAKDHLPEAEVAAWADEQEALARAGRFFFSLSHFVTVARKPGP